MDTKLRNQYHQNGFQYDRVEDIGEYRVYKVTYAGQYPFYIAITHDCTFIPKRLLRTFRTYKAVLKYINTKSIV